MENISDLLKGEEEYRKPRGMISFSLCSSSPAAFAVIGTARISSRRQLLEPGIIFRRGSSSLSMSTEGKVKDGEKKTSVPVESERKSPVPEPTPPEKPLPGDCCGSGCVRCVWDLYYEELEEYNNLLRNINTTTEQTSEIDGNSN